MPQSLSKVVVHIIFSTKNRVNFLEENIRLRMYAYIATVLRDMKSFVYCVDGTENHIHIACTLPRTFSQSDFLNKIKNSSSKWIKNEGFNDFYWQCGFGIFSISESHIDALVKYIKSQMKHHKTKTFKEEFKEFFEKYNIDYDEKYVWD